MARATDALEDPGTHRGARAQDRADRHGPRATEPTAAAVGAGRPAGPRGPGALGRIVAGLSDGALIDSRVLLAHRLGGDEAAWPPAEDRFASDLLLPDRVRDPWLAELTHSAVDATVPILLGGHALVGPGVHLALGDFR